MQVEQSENVRVSCDREIVKNEGLGGRAGETEEEIERSRNSVSERETKGDDLLHSVAYTEDVHDKRSRTI